MQYSQIRLAAEKAFTEDLSQLFTADLVRSIMQEARVEVQDSVLHARLQGHSFKVSKEMMPGLFL